MRLLLDTHTVIWHREGSEQLSPAARAMIAESGNQAFISIATLWEMAIKRSLGKLTTARTPLEILEIYKKGGAGLLPILPEHVMAVERLPWHHRDPFDRMLIAQAQTAGLTLITKDTVFQNYDVPLAW